jgi:hypothetical protein
LSWVWKISVFSSRRRHSSSTSGLSHLQVGFQFDKFALLLDDLGSQLIVDQLQQLVSWDNSLAGSEQNFLHACGTLGHHAGDSGLQ